MKFSILTATYNRAKCLPKLYESLIKNKSNNYEIEWLIMDDGSKDETENLIKDVTNWLLILAPVLTACLIGYYLLRKSASDEMDTKRWDNRIKIAIISCIGVVIASGLINIIIGYYR